MTKQIRDGRDPLETASQPSAQRCFCKPQWFLMVITSERRWVHIHGTAMKEGGRKEGRKEDRRPHPKTQNDAGKTPDLFANGGFSSDREPPSCGWFI